MSTNQLYQKFGMPSNYSIRYQTEHVTVSPVHQICFLDGPSWNCNCLVSPKYGSVVPHSFFLTVLFSCTAME